MQDLRKNPHSAIGLYINYLEIGDLIVQPIFEIKGNKDQKVIDLLGQVFHGILKHSQVKKKAFDKAAFYNNEKFSEMMSIEELRSFPGFKDISDKRSHKQSPRYFNEVRLVFRLL